MPTTATLRKKARALAERLGCHIEVERMGFGADQTITYWVWPGDPYTEDQYGPRRYDPNSGNHHACDYGEVMTLLRVYEYDLTLAAQGISWNRGRDFYWAGIAADWVRAIMAAADPDLLRTCRFQPSDRAPWLVLADWLRERGFSDLADAVEEVR